MKSIKTITYSRKLIDITKINQFNIYEIAHCLGNLCRFNGHTMEFYSVAQHSFICSEIADDEYKLQALLHDSAEAYLGDITTPIKEVLGKDFKKLEEDLLIRIFNCYGVNYPINEQVKKVDKLTLEIEMEQFFGIPNWLGFRKEPEQTFRIGNLLNPAESKKVFLNQFHKLTNDKYRK